jgi:hypothetical protein
VAHLPFPSTCGSDCNPSMTLGDVVACATVTGAAIGLAPRELVDSCGRIAEAAGAVAFDERGAIAWLGVFPVWARLITALRSARQSSTR